MLPKGRSYCRIPSFALKKFGKRLIFDKIITDEVLDHIICKLKEENLLVTEVELNSWLLPFIGLEISPLLNYP